MKNRKIGYTYGSVSGHYPFRNQKSISFESTLEKDLITYFDFNMSVDDICEQPLTIEYINSSNKKVKYTPDFLITFKHKESNKRGDKLLIKPLLIEVKPSSKLKKEWNKYRERFKIATKYAKQNDMIFKIFTEDRINGDYFKNIQLVKRYKNYKYEKEDIQRVIEHVEYKGMVSIDHILEYHFVTNEAKGIGLGLIYHLLSNRYLLTNLSSPVNMQSIVYVNENYTEENYEF